MSTVTFKGKVCNLSGNELNTEDMAPQVSLVNSKDLADITVGGSQQGVQLIIVVPSLDTPVCATEARKFNNEVSSIKDVAVTVVSMDLPFAAKRFCSTEGIDNLTVVSDFRSKEFASSYGVLVADGPLAGLTCRAILVVNKEGKIVYKEIVPEITDEPDYDGAIKAAQDTAFVSTSCCGGCH
jgi:thiol peroxidase